MSATEPSTLAPSLSIAGIQELAAPDMNAVDQLIRQRLSSDVVLINQVAEHIVSGGGKRLRPMLTVLTARAFSYKGQDHQQLAAIIEFIHTATLLHDDVVDESSLRRGRETANALFGNAASVLVGDFLYSRSFQLMVDLDDLRIQRILADTTNQIAEGEVMQLLHVRNPRTDERAYMQVIERKTAVLFAAATQLGALISGRDERTQAQLASYGLNLGFAFQIADDVLDYTADAQTMGKNLGDDLAEGKATLPLIHAMAHCNAPTHQRLSEIIESGDVGAMPEVLVAIEQHQSIAYSQQRALEFARKAQQCLCDLPESNWRDALWALAEYSVNRKA